MDLALQQAIDAHSVITFDVYDTLIYRVLYRDRDVWHLVDREYQKRNHVGPIDFYRKRELSDRKARKSYPYREVTIDEIYEVFADLYGRDLADACKRLEIELEINLTFPNNSVVEAFHYALQQGKEVYIISDMYLTDTTIAKVLEHNGIVGYEKLFVSCLYRKTKHESGELFVAVLDEIQTQAKNVLHVGNDVKADIERAISRGLDAYLVKPPSRTQYVDADKAKFDLNYSLLYGFITKYNPSHTLAYRLGFDVFGPIVTGFMEWIQQQQKIYHLDTILFLARDGYVLQRISDSARDKADDSVRSKLDDSIDTFYSYLSRRSVVIPLLQYQESLEDIWNLYKSWQPHITLTTVFNRLGIPYDKEAVQSVGLSDSDTFTRAELSTDSRIQSLYNRVKERAMVNSEEQGRLLYDYLRQYGEHKTIGIVDLGSGTIIEALKQFSSINHIDIDWTPLYLQNSRKPSESYININENYELQTALRMGYMFLEVFFTAPHGTTLGYTRTDQDTIDVVLEEYEYESIPDSYKARLQELHQGAIDFYNGYPIEMTRYGSIDTDIVMTDFNYFILHPTDEDLVYWGPYPVYIDSFEPMVHCGTLQSYVSHPKQLFYDFKNSVWPAGFLHAMCHSNILLRLLSYGNQLRLILRDKWVKR
ncbi:hypothetical protein [Veillonella sp. AS16]|uniref:hypothetical protein n=1 Tax=Veillonella sp. AS16 TaxID=936589 RepID=UPI0003E21B25|nr:hypothetical protein [Veillonella sp. AS16]ETS92421.1 haloacid dehalogenase-like hydrolase [Veillonella sp. AS16]